MPTPRRVGWTVRDALAHGARKAWAKNQLANLNLTGEGGGKVSKRTKDYRIKSYGDGACTVDVDGWAAVVTTVAEMLYDKPTPEEIKEAGEMLIEGVDGGEGWDESSVYLQFEDGAISVEVIGGRKMATCK